MGMGYRDHTIIEKTNNETLVVHTKKDGNNYQEISWAVQGLHEKRKQKATFIGVKVKIHKIYR